MESQDTRVPVTLLTGFLGAGKTTLLNHLIRDPEAGRIAVIMNEFGDVGLDHDLIEEATEETILMQSGCLCCSIRGDLLKTLGRLMARRNGGDLHFDRVVIETTGIADPGPILHSLIVDTVVAPYYRMDGVVTLADAVNGARTLDRQFEAVQQVAMADLIVLSKTDLVTPRDLTRFEARLEALNGTARRVQARMGQVPPGHLFGLTALRDNVVPDEIANWLGQAPRKVAEHVAGQVVGLAKGQVDPLTGLSGLPLGPGAASGPSSAGALPDARMAVAGDTSGGRVAVGAGAAPAPGAPHDHRIVSASITLDRPIPGEIFDLWLDALIAMNGPSILRMKGILHVEGLDCPFVFHGVQHIFDAPVPMKRWDGQDTTSRVVVIARDLSQDTLQADLDALRTRLKALETGAETVPAAQTAETAPAAQTDGAPEPLE